MSQGVVEGQGQQLALAAVALLGTSLSWEMLQVAPWLIWLSVSNM